MIRLLTLTGSHYEIGHQHGEQIADLRPHLQNSIADRLENLRPYEQLARVLSSEMAASWEIFATGTLGMMRGITDALGFDWDNYFHYTISRYLLDRIKEISLSEGCTTWAARGELTINGEPFLVKNRDYHPDHIPLQCLARVRPIDGHPYLCLTSAGSPGVFSSGINDAGLAVVDTYVASNDLGPGVTRYSLMMDILEKFTKVQEAVEYLPTLPHSGCGTVTVADPAGDLAVFEIAHFNQEIRRTEDDFICSANHFTAPKTSAVWTDREPEGLRGNSQARREWVETTLQKNRGEVDVPLVQRLMAHHGDRLDSICRHGDIEQDSVTISNVILLPKQRGMYVANGLPCSTPHEFYAVMD